MPFGSATIQVRPRIEAPYNPKPEISNNLSTGLSLYITLYPEAAAGLLKKEIP